MACTSEANGVIYSRLIVHLGSLDLKSIRSLSATFHEDDLNPISLNNQPFHLASQTVFDSGRYRLIRFKPPELWCRHVPDP